MSEDVEIPTRQKTTREDIQNDNEHWMTHRMMKDIYEELLICKTLIDGHINHSGWDSAFFDVEVDLRVRFGESTVRVRDAWKAIQP